MGGSDGGVGNETCGICVAGEAVMGVLVAWWEKSVHRKMRLERWAGMVGRSMLVEIRAWNWD